MDRARVWGTTQLGTTSICFRGLGADRTHFFFPCWQTAGPSSVFACGFRRMVYALKGEGTGPRSRLLLSGSSVLERRVLGRGRVATVEKLRKRTSSSTAAPSPSSATLSPSPAHQHHHHLYRHPLHHRLHHHCQHPHRLLHHRYDRHHHHHQHGQQPHHHRYEHYCHSHYHHYHNRHRAIGR